MKVEKLDRVVADVLKSSRGSEESSGVSWSQFETAKTEIVYINP